MPGTATFTNLKIGPVFNDTNHGATPGATVDMPASGDVTEFINTEEYVTRAKVGTVLTLSGTYTYKNDFLSSRDRSYVVLLLPDGSSKGGALRTSKGSSNFSFTFTVQPGESRPLRLMVRMKDSATPGYPVDYPGSSEQLNYQFDVLPNRPPSDVQITAPAQSISLPYKTNTEASRATVNFQITDPDALSETGMSGAAKWGARDLRGFEVQVSPYPTPDNPSPPWSPATLTFDADGVVGAPVSYWFVPDLWTGVDPDSILRIQAESGYATAAPPHVAFRLTPGAWRYRLRTFDRETSATSTPANAPVSSISPWSNPRTIYVTDSTQAPALISPSNDEAYSGTTIRFSWEYRTPIPARYQIGYEVFLREADLTPTPAWTSIAYVFTGTSGTAQFLDWTNGTGYTLVPGKRYEWTAATRNSAGNYSEKTTPPESFYWTAVPGSGAEIPVPEIVTPDPGLGCGNNRVFVYSRGGKRMIAEITQMSKVVWNRVRDDISSCDVTVRGWSDDCGSLLASLRCWQYELVVFRENGSGDPKRVWEGPITRLSYESDQVSIEARDVMAYVYRRILRQGYNDAYRVVGRKYDASGNITSPGTVVSTPITAVQRADIILRNALAIDDPNVIPYMWSLRRADDAKQSRVVPEWSRTAWQEVDDLAAKAGLDYTTVGRRIMLWDTHNSIGYLPEMTDGDFESSPVVTEYGMQTATVYGVSNNNGVYGSADRDKGPYGFVEMLISAWGESDEAGAQETLTGEALRRMIESLNEQAERGINQRYPTPLVARVPDNSTLSPDLAIGINQLVPGVWVPLRASQTLRKIRQVQKLDSLKVTQEGGKETVQVTFSPAPSSRDADPDSDVETE